MSFLSKGECNSEPEGKEERAEMCQWHKLHRSATERGAMEHPEFEADATKENGGGCNEPEDVPILPAERDRESLEGCLRITEWWSNSRSCHRMSEDAAETGSEEVRRWAVKRTGERSENRKNAERSSCNPGKGKRVEVTRSSGGSYRKNAQRSDAKAESGVKWIRLEWHTRSGGDPRKEDSMERARKRICEEKRNKEEPSWGDLIHKENAPELVGSEMDGAVMEQYWRRSGGLEVREVRRHLPGCANAPGDIGDDTRGDIRDEGDNRRCRNDTDIGGLGGRQKMTSGLAFRLQESGKVAARNLIGSTDQIEGRASGSNDNMHQESNEDIRQEVLNGREGGWSVTEDAQRHEGEVKTTTKSSKSGVPLEVQRTQRRRQWNRKGLQRSTKGGTDGDYHEVTRSGVP
ncbi:hypothetical protein L210DRAFT_3500313 [Boletus edulis BED1]|uniref:Uncharacterized protein n=1 Tax=Boletus edulis BED1 TaxID=1328754 RepID=A0AAD4C7T5_BOLED|nr:hypothetical protein L210DRAFT_3500313 [Boletus edulis BED1]